MTTIGGLPAHILLVHAVVVLVPLAALLVVLVTAWPAARARLTLPTAIIAVVALVAVPLTTSAGEWLEHRVPRTALLSAHTALGDTLLPWVVGLAVLAAAVQAREWRAARTPACAPSRWGGRMVSVALAVVAVVVAVGSVVTVYEIGDSGTRAAWTGRFTDPSQQTALGVAERPG
jgi:hypothetical protein